MERGICLNQSKTFSGTKSYIFDTDINWFSMLFSLKFYFKCLFHLVYLFWFTLSFSHDIHWSITSLLVSVVWSGLSKPFIFEVLILWKIMHSGFAFATQKTAYFQHQQHEPNSSRPQLKTSSENHIGWQFDPNPSKSVQEIRLE